MNYFLSKICNLLRTAPSQTISLCTGTPLLLLPPDMEPLPPPSPEVAGDAVVEDEVVECSELEEQVDKAPPLLVEATDGELLVLAGDDGCCCC